MTNIIKVFSFMVLITILCILLIPEHSIDKKKKPSELGFPNGKYCGHKNMASYEYNFKPKNKTKGIMNIKVDAPFGNGGNCKDVNYTINNNIINTEKTQCIHNLKHYKSLKIKFDTDTDTIELDVNSAPIVGSFKSILNKC